MRILRDSGEFYLKILENSENPHENLGGKKFREIRPHFLFKKGVSGLKDMHRGHGEGKANATYR